MYGRASAKSHLRNVFRFDQVVNIKENLNRDTKLEQIVDDPLNPVASLHLVCRGRSLLLAERSRAALKYDLLDDPGGAMARVMEDSFGTKN